MPTPSTFAQPPSPRGDAGTNRVKRFLLLKANRELELLQARLMRLRARFEDAGAEYDDRVRQLDAVGLRLEALQARVLPMGMFVRLAHSRWEEAEVQAIAIRIDRIVEE